MSYLDKDNNSKYNRISRNLGATDYERPLKEKAAETTATAESNDFMTSEERRTDILRVGLECALDALNAKGCQEAFDIANHLHSTLRSDYSKSLVDKYL